MPFAENRERGCAPMRDRLESDVRRLAIFLDVLGRSLFVAGLLWVGVLGTATGVPFHGLGLAAVGAAVLLTGLSALMLRRPPPGGLLPLTFALTMAWLAGRAWMSPVRHLADYDLMLMAAATGGFAVVWFSGKARWVLPWLWLLAVGSVVIGVYQVAFDPSFCLLSPLGLARPITQSYASGFFYHSNPYGTWSAMLLLLALSVLIFHRGWSLLRVGAAAAAAVAALGLMLSFCRAAFGGFGVGLGVMALAAVVSVFRIKASPIRRLATGLGLMLVLALVGYGAARWLPHLAQMRMGSDNFENIGKSMEGRDRYWSTGLSQFLEAPVCGTGSRTFSYLSYRFWDRRINNHDADPEFAHSEYIQTAAEYGVIGLLLVVVLAAVALGRAFRVAARLARRDGTRQGRAEVAWCLGVLGAGIAFLVDVVFSFSGHLAPIALLCGVLLGGLAVAGRGGLPAASEERRGGTVAWISVGPLIVVAVVFSVFLLGPGLKYGIAMTRLHLEWAAMMRGATNSFDYVDITRRELTAFDRHPILIHHAEALRMAVAEAEANEEEREVLSLELLDTLDRAVEAFAESVETLLMRAEAREAASNRDGADEDFALAAELGVIREFHYRSWMKWGEAWFRRAVEAWYAGDMREASRMLAKSLDAYETSRKLGWVRGDNTRYLDGRKKVEDTIGLFKRTREWEEPSEGPGER